MTDPCRINEPAVVSDDVAARRKASGRGGWRPGAGRKPELEDPVSVTIDLERPQAERLRAIADDRGVSLASLVRKAVGAYLRRQKGD
jgi:hypothetical protein